MYEKTLRVLSIQGGGSRGYVPIKFLLRLCQQWGISSSDLFSRFDVIAGTSIGGILALALADGQSLEDIEPLFIADAKSLFSPKVGTVEKIAKLALNQPFYSADPLQAALVRDFTSEKTLSQLKTNVVVPSFEKDMSRYVMFSNFNDPMFVGQNESVVNVARATSAAPLYLPHHTFNTHDYIDGGLYANNPAEVAVNLGTMIKPTANRICVLDVGTGLGGANFDGSEPLTGSDHSVSVLFNLMNVAMAGSQEMVNFNMKIRASRTLEELYYYRFQPTFPADVSREIDNSADSWFTKLEEVTSAAYANDSNNISIFLGHLTA